MAVPEFLRKSRTMQVYVKARKILIHTRQIIASEKNIPKRHQRRFADPLDQAATKLFTCMCMANAIHPGKKTCGELPILACSCAAGEHKINHPSNGQAVLRGIADGQKGEIS